MLYYDFLQDIMAMAGDPDGRRLKERAKDHGLTAITNLILNGRNTQQDCPGLIQLKPDVHFNRVDLCTFVYTWSLSGSGTNEYYLSDKTGGVFPVENKPDAVYEDDVEMTEGTLGSLAKGEWGYGDNDTLGQDTIYVRLSDDADPDDKEQGYVETTANTNLTPIYERVGSLEILDILTLFPNPYLTTGNTYGQNFAIKTDSEVEKIARNSNFGPPDNEVYVHWSGQRLYAIVTDANTFDPGSDSVWMKYIENPDDSEWDDSKTEARGGTVLTEIFTTAFLKAATRQAAKTLLEEDNI